MNYYGIYRESGKQACFSKFRDVIAATTDSALLEEIADFMDFKVNYLDSVSTEEINMKYEDVIGWWRNQNVVSSNELNAVLDNFKIVFACNSNGIEGSTVDYHTTRAIFEEGAISNFNGTAREIFETQNQKFAFEFLYKAFDRKEPITVEFIQHLHSILLYGCYDTRRWENGERPGTFKVHDYCVGSDDVGSYPEDVLDDLNNLLQELQEAEGEGDVLAKAAYLHVVFETIHPFADGNGRVGRALLNYYLLCNGHPPIVIYNEDKETYYLALEVFNKTEKLSGFIQFLKEQTVKTWKRKITPRKVKPLSSFL